MHPVDKVLIENWFICSLCLITSCPHWPCSTRTGAQPLQARAGRVPRGAGIDSGSLPLPHPPLGPSCFLPELALSLAGRAVPSLPPSSLPVAGVLQWGQDPAPRLLPPPSAQGVPLPAQPGRASHCVSTPSPCLSRARLPASQHLPTPPPPDIQGSPPHLLWTLLSREAPASGTFWIFRPCVHPYQAGGGRTRGLEVRGWVSGSACLLPGPPRKWERQGSAWLPG